METEVKAVPEIEYTDPFSERTRRKSVAWHNLLTLYLQFKVELKIENTIVPLDQVEWNPQDGGSWRWNTPLFEKEVDSLIESIQSTGKFEAIWLRKDTNGSTYSVVDGHHRVAAWKKMGHPTVAAVVINVSPFVSEF
jgi:ParB-like nuclease domain